MFRIAIFKKKTCKTPHKIRINQGTIKEYKGEIIMEKLTLRFIPEINREVKVVIHEIAAVAIKYGWESLAFSENDECFGEVYIDNMMFHLTTRGDVRLVIESPEESIILLNKNGEELREIIDNKTINNYYVDNNNWFELLIGTTDEDEFTDGVVFEVTPKTISELEDELISYAIHQFKYEAGISA